jgi:hypothetical protein
VHCDADWFAVPSRRSKVTRILIYPRACVYSLYSYLLVLFATLIVVVSLGVEAVEVDREENKVTVTGDFKTEKLL